MNEAPPESERRWSEPEHGLTVTRQRSATAVDTVVAGERLRASEYLRLVVHSPPDGSHASGPARSRAHPRRDALLGPYMAGPIAWTEEWVLVPAGREVRVLHAIATTSAESGPERIESRKTVGTYRAPRSIWDEVEGLEEGAAYGQLRRATLCDIMRVETLVNVEDYELLEFDDDDEPTLSAWVILDPALMGSEASSTPSETVWQDVDEEYELGQIDGVAYRWGSVSVDDGLHTVDDCFLRVAGSTPAAPRGRVVAEYRMTDVDASGLADAEQQAREMVAALRAREPRYSLNGLWLTDPDLSIEASLVAEVPGLPMRCEQPTPDEAGPGTPEPADFGWMQVLFSDLSAARRSNR